jgi:hypothetical protein
MATLALASAGASVGASIGGSLFGISAATIGGAIGTAAGSVVDSWIVSSLAPGQRSVGQRLDDLRVTTASEGGVIPRVYGHMRLAGNLIWATDFVEEISEATSGGGKGTGPSVTTITYLYSCSFAVGLCEGQITGIGRIWADGELLDTSTLTWRWYPGDETQVADPFIATTMGEEVPAYRGVAYAVFEGLPLAPFGNRIPQLTFEVWRPLAEEDTAEGLVRAVTLIPASGEFTYATENVRRETEGTTLPVNVNALPSTPDIVVALDQLQAAVPGIESVSLVVAWFGDDLRCGHCRIRPGVETAAKDTEPVTWSVNGIDRAAATVVSSVDGKPVYGGTPTDRSIVQAIGELKARGLRVTFYPFILMDVPADNVLPDPYSDGAATLAQPPFPWRGRITCSPAAGMVGTVDKTAAAEGQVEAFFGAAEPSDFTVAGEEVSWTGDPADWGLRRMVLHYAHLCAAADGVDAFLIGTEMRGITQVRSGPSSYPGVAAFRALAADVRGIVGSGTKLGYAADWSEYFGHHPSDGSGDVFFHLDPLWADANIDLVGIDNYMPLSDWRDGFAHADAELAPAIYDRAYLQSNIAGGEGFDWFYASTADRAGQERTPITDGSSGKPWVFRYKDLRAWWSNRHFDRPGGVENVAPTPWVPESRPIWFTEFGCPAIDRGTNQPNVFFDPKSSESFIPYFSRGWRDDAIQRAYLEATLLWWGEAGHNPVSSVYGGRMVHLPESAAWTWDARPYPQFPALGEVWADGENWRLGHWLNGRLGSASLPALVRDLCRQAGLLDGRIDVSSLWGAVEGFVITAIESPRTSIATLGQLFGFDAVESEGVMRFRMRGAAPVATLTVDDLVAGANGVEPFELTRGQETELPRVLKWQVTRSDEEYDLATVEARRGVAEAARVEQESFPVTAPPEEAERWCRRSLQERWIGRERATFSLPPSRLALDPGNAVGLLHDGREVTFRIESIADGEARRCDLVRMDREVYELPPGAPRAAAVATPVVFGSVEGLLLDLPQLWDSEVPHQPLVAAIASPWPGNIAVWRSPEEDGFSLLQTFSGRIRHGVLAEPLAAGPLGVFDYGNAIVVDMIHGKLASVSDTALFGGANIFAVESPAGWEVLQAGTATLVASGRYSLTRLLRGQFGTEDAMVASLAAGARLVVLDSAAQRAPVLLSEIGLPLHWRIGPASLPVSDDTFDALTFTPAARGLKPWSPAHVEDPSRIAYAGGDLTLRWVRRDRSLLADSWEVASIPMSEATEAWEVDILDGSTVLRTLETGTPTVTYTTAQQLADWGAPLAPGGTLRIRVCQLSAVVGRGVPLTVSLNL